MSSKFWTGVLNEFDLTGNCALKNLPKPSEAEAASQHLGSAILLTVHANPAMRSTDDFEGFFAYCSEVNYTELHGALQGCVPNLNLSGHHLQQMERILLRFFGGFDIKGTFAHIWDLITDHFEEVAKTMWLESSGSGRANFVAGKIDVLALFMPKNSVLAVENALAAEEDGVLNSKIVYLFVC